ncbi:MAG: hypothetical protein R3324_00170 [Halobacteriales archaeon]|nr:hypothetical protein [Halobacteriales archaeon]
MRRLPILPNGTVPIPAEYREGVTIKTWRRTVVFQEGHAEPRVHETEHPELHPDEGDFRLHVSRHGSDEEETFALVPAEVMAEEWFEKRHREREEASEE